MSGSRTSNYVPIPEANEDVHAQTWQRQHAPMARWKVYTISIAVACAFITGLIVFSTSWATVEPTEYGFLYNKMNGHIDTTKIYDGGRYCTGPSHYFVKYPRTQTTIEFSARSGADSVAVVTRTQDGVAITLSFAFQYRFEKGNLSTVYDRYTSNYKQPMIRIARNSMLQTASQYSAMSYWQMRAPITDSMKAAMKTVLESTIFCVVEDFQLLRVDLPSTYESSIIATQVQQQQVMQQQYEQQVAAYMSQIQTITAQANQIITVMNAQANANVTQILNLAHVQAFNFTQHTQAQAYANIQKTLTFNSTQFVRYLKIRSLRQKSGGAITVGLTP